VSTIEELLGRKNSGSGLETEITVVGIRHVGHVAPPIRKVGTVFADKRRSLGWYGSLADSGHEDCFVFVFILFYSLPVLLYFTCSASGTCRSTGKGERIKQDKLLILREAHMRKVNHFLSVKIFSERCKGQKGLPCQHSVTNVVFRV
jgi:hypothetical protein